jgi:hypothetical protein
MMEHVKKIASFVKQKPPATIGASNRPLSVCFRFDHGATERGATVLQIEIIQVLNDGCLARVLNDNGKEFLSNSKVQSLPKVRGMKFERSNGEPLNTRLFWAHPLPSSGGLPPKSRIEATAAQFRPGVKKRRTNTTYTWQTSTT